MEFVDKIVVGVVIYQILRRVLRALKPAGAVEPEGAGEGAPGASGGADAGWLMQAGDQLRDALGEALALGDEARRLRDGLHGAPGTAPIMEVLDEVTAQTLERARVALAEAVDALDSGTAEAPTELLASSHELGRAFDLLNRARAQITALGQITRWRLAAPKMEVLGDADALATALLDPLRRFARTHDLGFPDEDPLCVPASPGDERVVLDLFPGHPVIFVPDSFGEDLLRWPAIAHEAGHILWRSMPAFEADARRLTPSAQPPWLPRLHGGRLVFDLDAAFAVWLEEIVADAFAALLLGPAALRGLMAVFASPEEPDAVLAAAVASDGRTLAEHPPRHLRVRLMGHLLGLIGHQAEARALLHAWDEQHGDPDRLLFPTPRGQWIAIPEERVTRTGYALIERLYNDPYESLAGYTLSSVHDLEMSPGQWREVENFERALLDDTPFQGNPKWVMAAAVQAAAHSPGAQQLVARGMRRAIMGRDMGERRLEDPNFKTRRRKSRRHLSRAEVRQAILLRQILVRPQAPRREHL